MPKRLVGLENEEVSLVPKAANKRRFLLLKGDTPMIDEVKALDTITKLDANGSGELIERLAGEDAPETAELLKGVPDADQAAVKAAIRVMGKDLALKVLKAKAADAEDATDNGADEADETDDMPPAKKKAKGKKKQDDPAADLTKADESENLRKAQDEITELREALQKSEADKAKAEADRRREQFVRKAAEFKHLPGVTADDMGSILEKADRLLPKAENDKLVAVLKSANEIVGQSALFGERGSAASGEKTAYGEITAKAEDLRKADGKLTLEQARARVIKSNPDLFRRYQTEIDDLKRTQRGS